MLRKVFNANGGAAAAEFAMILPLSLLLLFTALEAGHYMYQRHQVVKGLRDGARFAARHSFDDINCRGGSGTIDGDLRDNVINLTRTGQISGGSPRVKNWQIGDITINVTCPTAAESETGIFEAAEPAPQVNISTSFTYDSFFNGLGVVNDSFRLGGSQQAIVMGI
ncbi:TadE-like protein [Altererythrobacter xiamenensis]|uniref:TadE-like protein n=2 Tax=Altererythrobacter xiamenensis TaxID=1316679 RepID=A0A1Y6E822_9SPHN|nr:TadE-like protein [Altererythrobacter xiamenensis]